jgi:hypothetical protein
MFDNILAYVKDEKLDGNVFMTFYFSIGSTIYVTNRICITKEKYNSVFDDYGDDADRDFLLAKLMERCSIRVEDCKNVTPDKFKKILHDMNAADETIAEILPKLRKVRIASLKL